jgi:hypothetical protein
MLTAVAAGCGALPHGATLLRDGWLYATIVHGLGKMINLCADVLPRDSPRNRVRTPGVVSCPH